MVFKAWESFARKDRIELQCREGGPVYQLPEVSAELGMQIRLAREGKKVPMDTLGLDDEAKLILGEELYQRMVADEVPDEMMLRAVIVVLYDWQFGRAEAERVWEAGVDPKALIAKAQATLTRSGGSTPSPSTAGEPASTPRTARSTRGTTSRKRTPRAAKQTATSAGHGSRTTGRSSSPTGTGATAPD